MKWYEVGQIDDEKAFIKKITIGNKKLCLVKYQDGYFALSAKCPHAGADLSTGWCENGKIICPFHRYSYNLLNGRGSEPQGDYVETYSVEIRENSIYIGVPSFWDSFKSK